jgi:hypothetical protein
MSNNHLIFIIGILLSFLPKENTEIIKTTLQVDGKTMKGVLLVDHKNKLSPVVSFDVEDAKISALLNKLSPGCKRIIGLGFVKSDKLDESLQSLNLKTLRSNERVNTYCSKVKPHIEVIKNNENSLLIGASTYKHEQLKEKVIFKHKNKKLTECQIQINKSPLQKIINLKFNSNE